MRLATIRTEQGTRAARVEDGHAVLLPFTDVQQLLRSGEDWHSRAAAAGGERLLLADELYAPVVPNPDKIVCLGLNYVSHIEEMGRPRPTHPTLFAKYSGALIGAYDPIVLPAVSEEVDWEAELGFVVGKAARHVSPDRAWEYIAGYTIVNDVTVRDWQHRTREFLSGKTFEATTPVGPTLVTPDEFAPGSPDLELRCSVDGSVVQHARTDDLLFKVAEILSYISTIITLLPGDLVATGTPGGVGAGRTPKMFMHEDQVLVTAIEGLGEQRNICVKERVHE
ncbi:fumarylacetoacetate hydrolase family protein [Streptomyces griseoaurantiacus]|uniref:fumarylacetoacetate hydrolase family protein n=1 Tax=Streptomyces griseoaurantiacus TaxID=68213 RepID=UPI0037B0DDC2